MVYELIDERVADKTPTFDEEYDYDYITYRIVGHLTAGSGGFLVKPMSSKPEAFFDNNYAIWQSNVKDHATALPANWIEANGIKTNTVDLVTTISSMNLSVASTGKAWMLSPSSAFQLFANIPANVELISYFQNEKFIMVGTSHGYYEFPDISTVSGKMTIPSETVHTSVYNRRDLRNLTVTGFYTIDGMTYISSSRGVWVIDHSTKMLWEL